ncbi:hypothetical protein Aperf_G00000064456 [Anoplocephala perfoliata]
MTTTILDEPDPSYSTRGRNNRKFFGVVDNICGNSSTTSSSSSLTLPSTSGATKYLDHEDTPSWPAELLLEWWIDPEIFGCGPSDCMIESEVLRLGGAFLHTWQKKHARLFPNRLEIYNKNQQGIPLKGAELLIVPSEFLRALEASSQILRGMSRKVYWIYGIDEPKLYAKVSPSSSNSSQTQPPPPPVNPDLAAKRKQFRRMQSFQTALTSRNWSSPPPPQTQPQPQPQMQTTLQSGCMQSTLLAQQPPAAVDLTSVASSRRAILKNFNKMMFSRSQDVTSPLLPECTKTQTASGHHKQT